MGGLPGCLPVASWISGSFQIGLQAPLRFDSEEKSEKVLQTHLQRSF